jgi:hypothetical protein
MTEIFKFCYTLVRPLSYTVCQPKHSNMALDYTESENLEVEPSNQYFNKPSW